LSGGATVCYRFADFGTPLRTVPARQPARFSAPDEPEPTQYLSLHPLGPHAELVRNNDFRSREQILAIRTRTWALQLDLDGVPEITFDNAGAFDVTARDLVADDHTACRRLATRLRARHRGVIVPSAALPGTRNVVLFGARVAAPYVVEPVTPLDVPASITAQDGRPLLSLLELVRFKGDPHPALEAWAAGETFRFDEPDGSPSRERAA
jgi:hypothetical protein